MDANCNQVKWADVKVLKKKINDDDLPIQKCLPWIVVFLLLNYLGG